MKKLRLHMSELPVRRVPPKFIVIHHTACMYALPQIRIDSPRLQISGIYKGALEQKGFDVNYHYVIDRIENEFIPIVSRPLATLCDFIDIKDEINLRAIHIAVMGSYDLKIPEKRLYEILAYRVINPLVRLFKIPMNKVVFHKEVSENKQQTCPGEFLEKNIMIAKMRSYIIK